jgi:hypothetical protein
LTDYVLGQTLANAYADQMQSGGDADSDDDSTADVNAAADSDDAVYAQTDTPITPEIKQQIAAEVQHQIAYESAVVSGAAQPSVGEFPASLQRNRVFVATTMLDVATTMQQTCGLTAGDVLLVEATPPQDSPTAALRVASSHRQDCPAGAIVSVLLIDLQAMQNSLRAELDAGLQALHNNQGQSGLPPAPLAAMGATQPSSLGAPDADANVAALIEAQQQSAKQTEASIVHAASAGQNQ